MCHAYMEGVLLISYHCFKHILISLHLKLHYLTAVKIVEKVSLTAMLV